MQLFAVSGLPEIRPGDDLAALLEQRADLEPSDVICVASTVVSKAEGRQADLADFEPVSERAEEIAERIGALTDEEKDPRFAAAVLAESEELILDLPILLAATRFGHITVNAGIDRSNVPDADLLLLPEDPTASAERIRAGLAEGMDVAPENAPAVVVTDTSGRPFRQGQAGVALGWAGIPAARDWRGEHDRDGREMGVTVEAVVDELAAAANLLTGEGDDGTPVAVVRDFDFGDHGGHDGLFREESGDLVRQALRAWDYEGADRDRGLPETDDQGVDDRNVEERPSAEDITDRAEGDD